MYNSAELIDLM